MTCAHRLRSRLVSMSQTFISAVRVHPKGASYDSARVVGHGVEACSFVHPYAGFVRHCSWQHCISRSQNVIPNESVSATAKPTKDVV